MNTSTAPQPTATTPPSSATSAAPDAGGNSSAPWTIVARREIVARLTDKAFVIGTVLTLVVMTGFMGLSTYLAGRTTTYTIVTTSATDEAYAKSLAPALTAIDDKVKAKTVSAKDATAARILVNDDPDTVWFHQGDQGWVMVGKDEVPSSLAAAATTAIRTEALQRNASAAGTTVAALTAGATLKTDVLNGDAERQGFAKAMGFIFAFLFFMASLTFGMSLSGSVVEEKASRLVEIITARIPVRQLLAGKVLAHTTLALGQMALYIGVGLIGLTFTPYSSYLSSISSGIGWFVAFFLVGFLLLACLWAAAGAMASRTEDLQSTVMPLSYLLMGVWFSAFLAKGAGLVALSFVPPFSAVLMPMRLLQGGVPLWQPIVALAVLIATAGAVVLIAERLYRRSLLQTQGRVSWKAAWSAAE